MNKKNMSIALFFVFTISCSFSVCYVSATSDWPMFHHDPMHMGNTDSYGPLTNQTLWSYTAIGPVYSSPAVANGVVYVGSLDYSVYALNATSGAKIWSYITGQEVYSSPCVANGIVYIGSYDHNLYALDATTGVQIWNYTTGSTILTSPCVTNGVVYFGSMDGSIYALNALTGAKIWNYTTDNIVWSSPCLANGIIYFGSYFYLYALDATTGAQLWNYTTGSTVWSSPCVSNGIVYFGSYDGFVYSLNATSGSQIWSYPTGHDVFSSPCIANGVLYVGTGDGNVYALNATSGEKIWNYKTGDVVNSSPCITSNGIVFFGSDDGNVYALDAATGTKIWSYRTSIGRVFSSPCAVNDIVYIGANDGTSGAVYAFNSNLFNLTMLTVGEGFVLPGNSSHLSGSSVDLKAIPAAGWSFSGWSGDASGTGNTTITMNADKTVTATFVQNIPDTYNITTSVTGQGVISRNATEPYSYGQAVNLTALADGGWFFVGWSGDLSGSSNPATLIVDANKSVTATFAQIQQSIYTLTINTVGQGSVSRNASAPYTQNQAVELTATAASGYQFAGWSGDLVGQTNPATIIMDQNKTITATFTKTGTYTVTFTQTGLPQGTSWSVMLNGKTQTSSEETITFTNVAKGICVWRVQSPIPNGADTRSVADSTVGLLSVPSQSSKAITFITLYKLTINAEGLPAYTYAKVYLSNRLSGVTSTSSPLELWLNAGTSTGTIGVDSTITGLTSRSIFSNWTDGSVDNPRASIVMNAPTNFTANYTSQVKVTFFFMGVPRTYSGNILNVDGVNYTYTSTPIVFWWNTGSIHNYQYYSPLNITSPNQVFWRYTFGLSSQQQDTLSITRAGTIVAYYR
ncbi:MAG: PQQ-binding-like beta-propeller repeat protein [Candidatus Bathyarchaeota archaeon]|nr:PQQ-binding-like beta-propeller repeat protein [Candidatus Bathyarchaeota archaeon]